MKKLLLLMFLFNIQFLISQNNRFKPPSEKELPVQEFNFTTNSAMRTSANSRTSAYESVSTKRKKKFFIAKKSTSPNSESERYHLLQVNNVKNVAKNYTFEIEHFECARKPNRQTTDFEFEFYDLSKSNKITDLTVAAKDSIQFYVKITVPPNTKIPTLDCTYVKINNTASDEQKKIRIKSSIRNPKNYK